MIRSSESLCIRDYEQLAWPRTRRHRLFQPRRVQSLGGSFASKEITLRRSDLATATQESGTCHETPCRKPPFFRWLCSQEIRTEPRKVSRLRR